MPVSDLRIDGGRLLDRIMELAEVGAIDGGGVCRLALTDDDKAGRDLVVQWMHDLGLDVRIDAIGNVVAVRAGSEDGLAPVMTGSHIDTVRTGGKYDGNFGVLAGLEVIETLATHGIVTRHPLAVAFFTDEEGARFHPDMMGSLVYAGGMSIEDALDLPGIDGSRLGDELERIGYAGPHPCPGIAPHRFVELHVEQGPILEAEGITIGVVEGVQGISWQEITVEGQSNHAGTTPMRLRHDAGYAAARIAVRVREIAAMLGANQVGTVGSIRVHPDLINVVAARAVVTVDLRNTDNEALQQAEAMLASSLIEIATDEGVTITSRQTARFDPVVFDTNVVNAVETVAVHQGNSTRRMPSGAGHDAQMIARMCPTAMIFVPSVGGLSHNVAEFTEPADLVAGTNVLLHVMLQLADGPDANPGAH